MKQAGVFTRAENRRIRWIRDNLPLLAMRSDGELRKVIRQASAGLGAFRIVLNFLSVLVGVAVSVWLQQHFLDGTITNFESIAIFFVSVTVCGGLAGFVSERLVRRRLARFAEFA